MSKNIILPKIKNVTLIKDPRTGKDIIINEKGEELKNLEIKENNETGKKMIIDKKTLEIKSCISKINPENGKEVFLIKEEPKIKEKKNDIFQIDKIDIITYNDKRTGNEILINKKTGEEINNIEKKENPITGEIKLINKNNGKEIEDIKIKKDFETGKEYFSIQKKEIEEPKNKIMEITNIKDPRTGKNIFINKETGEEINNIEKKNDPITGIPILINKNTNKEIKGISVKIDPQNGNEIFIKKKEIIPRNSIKIITIKDPRTQKEILINKETGEEMKNLIKKIDMKYGDSYIINKDNNKEVKILKNQIDTETGEEIFLIRKNSKDNEIDNKINKVEIQIKKDYETGKEIIINKETGNILNNIKKVIDKDTGDKILINKNTGEKISDNLIRKIDPNTGDEIY